MIKNSNLTKAALLPLINEARDTFSDLLVEEQGIAREVQNETTTVFKEVCNIVKSKMPVNFNQFNKEGLYNIVDEQQIKLFGIDMILLANLYFFKDAESYMSCRNKGLINELYSYDHNGVKNNRDKSCLIITTMTVGTQILPVNLFSLIAHELRHAYSYFKSGKDNFVDANYDTAVKVLTGRDDNNSRKLWNGNIAVERTRQSIAYMVYLSQKTEWQSYADELYSELNRRKPARYFEILPECNPYIHYMNFKRNIEELEKNKNDDIVKNILVMYYNVYDVNKFINKLKKCLQNFHWYLSRAIGRYLADREETLKTESISVIVNEYAKENLKSF